MTDILVKVENLSKKFSHSFHHALRYEVQDLLSELSGGINNCRELRHDEFWALRDVSFEVKRGECLGIIGPNGAGKSTLLRIVNGLIKPDKGKVTIRGKVDALIALGAGFSPVLTGRENIYVNGSILGFSKNEIRRSFDAIVEYSELGQFIDMPVQNYSSGMLVRLGFSIAAQMRPDVLLIDEVLAVGDKGFRLKCLNTITEMIKDSAVIFVSHSMNHVNWICNQILTLNRGVSIYQGEDVSFGTQSYNALFGRQSKTMAGSGLGRILQVRLINQEGQDVSFLQNGDELSVCCDVQVDSQERQFAVHIGIFDQDSRLVISSRSNANGALFENRGEVMQAVVHLGQLPLSPGVYTINVSILDPSNKTAHYAWIAAKEFRIDGIYNPAVFEVQGEWQIQNAEKMKV